MEPRTSAAVTREHSPYNGLYGADHQRFVLELAKCGKSVDEMKEIVSRMFDDSFESASVPTLVVPIKDV